MNRARRSLALSLFVAAAGCSESSGRKPLVCQVDPDCPSEAKCILGACVAGSLPQAKILVHASQSELVSHRDITFDGSQSQDTNPRGSVTQYAWAVKRGRTAACDPTATAGSRPSFTTNFQCPGEYVVELQVTNDLKLQSLPEQATLEIAPSTNPPVIATIGPSVSAVHRCEGSPLVCRAFDANGSSAFQLTVAATDVEDGSNLAYSWTYQPPAGVDPAKAHVTFEPDANTPTPLVRIASDAAAIAGDWVFQAHVTDSNQLTSVKAQTLTVTNSPPVVALQGPAVVLDHNYFSSTNRYVANATVHAPLSDPDGDPISSAQLSILESAPSSCSFRVLSSAVAQDGFTGQIELSCARTAPQELIGQVARKLVLEVTDVNGSKVSDSLPLAVSNTAPILTWSAGGVAGTEPVAHSVVACPAGAEAPLCFAVDAPFPFAILDPEGDPLSAALSALGLPASGAFFSVSGGHFTLLVPVTKADLFSRVDGTSPITYVLAASDPWTSTVPATASFGLLIADQPPAISLLSTAPSAGHWYSTIDRAYHATFDLATAVDAEGDPLVPHAASSDGACNAVGVVNGRLQVACTKPYDFTSGPPTLSAFLFPSAPNSRTVWASASDPWKSSGETSRVPLTIQNRAPAVAYAGSTITALANCVCNHTRCEWLPQDAGTANFDPLVSDPDGDPLHLTISFSNGAPTIDKICFGSDCAASFSGGTTANLTVTDGVSPVSRSYPIVTSCSNDTSQPCGPSPGSFCP